MYSYWTESEINLLKKSFNEMTLGEMASLFPNRRRSSILRKIHLLGLHNKFIKSRFKLTFDQNFWAKHNPINCTLAGFCSADASLNKNNISLTIQLSQKDRNYLEQFKTLTNFNGTIYDRASNESFYNGRKIKSGVSSTLRFYQIENWISGLKDNFSIIPNKTKCLNPPRIDDMFLIACWVIGFIDGDGCWTISFRKNFNIWSFKLDFGSSVPFVFYWIDKYFRAYFPPGPKNGHGHRHIERRLNKGRGNDLHRYSISNQKAVLIFDCLSQLNVPKLARKWLNPEVLRVRDIYYERSPEYFEKHKGLIKQFYDWNKKWLEEYGKPPIIPV